MEEAIVCYSWQGILAQRIKAVDIKSRADARKIGPFADENSRRVYWVRWARVEKTGKWRKPHFKHYPKGISRFEINKSLDDEIENRTKSKGVSRKHKNAQDALTVLLQKMVDENKPANWSFVDSRISQFPLIGDLLYGVKEVRTEYEIETPFGKKYRLDIALLGDKVGKEPIILGGIELEYTHEFEMLKCLLCKTLGFPLVCLDLTEVGDDEINEEWCIKTLLETTTSSGDERRRNYIYIHDSLYPVYMEIPRHILPETRHQYIVFVNDADYDKLLRYLRRLKEVLGINDESVLIQPEACKNEQMRAALENEGSIAGHDWRKYNESKRIRISLDKPLHNSEVLYKYHLVMARLLNCHFETLVGYKYDLGIKNTNPDEHLWSVTRKIDGELKQLTLLPKHISEPVSSILGVLNDIQK